jgi:uncharacterized protein YlxW (UPF0749 family)
MKTLKLKIPAFISSLIIPVLIGAGSVVAQPAVSTVSIAKEHTDINNDIASINKDKTRLEALRKQYKNDRRDENRAAMISDCEQIKKTRADLQKNQSYLSADKYSLLEKHAIAVDHAKAAVKQDRKTLNASKDQLNKSRKKDVYADLTSPEAAVTRAQNEVKKSEENLKQQRLKRDNDLLEVNKEIRKANGAMAAVSYTQDSFAYTDKLINKNK